MASRIKLDKAGMENRISQLTRARESYDSSIDMLEKTITTLDEDLEGMASVSLKNRYEEKKATFKLFSQEIGEYISGMRKILAELPSDDQDVAQRIKSMEIGR